jgi:peptidoglycan/xylan/chitin deacetylase (PgdA/CDA1 family)
MNTLQWAPVITRQPAGVRRVGLTFDDGPHPETTPAVLELLRRHDGKATFFFTGERVALYPALVAATVDAGHAVYGHGWRHINLERAPLSTIVGEMERVESALRCFRPTPSTYLVRLPYNAGVRRHHVHEAARSFHPDPRFAWWSISTLDWLLARRCPDVAELRRRCLAVGVELATLPGLPGALVLMHEAPFGAEGDLALDVARTLLPQVLAALDRRGLKAGAIEIEPLAAETSREFGNYPDADMTIKSLPAAARYSLLERAKMKLYSRIRAS